MYAVFIANRFKEGCEKSGNIGSLGNSRCMHFFTLPEDPIMVRNIKPQKVVIFIFRPLCVALSPLWLFETLFQKYQKSLRGFGNRNARCYRPETSSETDA